jgi:hypothetical protein
MKLNLQRMEAKQAAKAHARLQANADRKAANMAALVVGSRSITPGTYAGATTGAVPKKIRAANGKAEQAHKNKLAEMGCMVCRKLFPYLSPGPVELHHLRADGWGKGDYLTLIPLCVQHHRGGIGIHGLGTKGFAKHYGFDQAELLMMTLDLVNRSPGHSPSN